MGVITITHKKNILLLQASVLIVISVLVLPTTAANCFSQQNTTPHLNTHTLQDLSQGMRRSKPASHLQPQLSVQQDTTTITITYDIPPPLIEPVQLEGHTYSQLTIPNEPVQTHAGIPELPTIVRSLILPETATVDVTIVKSKWVTYSDVAPLLNRQHNSYNLSQENTLQSSDFFSIDALCYPQQIVTLGDCYHLRDFTGRTLSLTPLQYNPSQKQLRWYTEITLKITSTEPLYHAYDAWTMQPSVIDPSFDLLYHRHFLNYPQTYSTLETTNGLIEEEGNMLIIVHDAYWQAMRPLLEWKNQKGIPTEMINTSDIPEEGSRQLYHIKNYLTTYYNTKGLTYVLLVGDYEHIECNVYMITGPLFEEGVADPWYADIIGDDGYPDIYIGRFSAQSVEDVETQVQRTIDYEKNPEPGASWYHHAMGMGANVLTDHSGGSELPFEHIRDIRSDLQAYTYTHVDEFYDGSQGGDDDPGDPTRAMVSDAINAGRGIINYYGYGWDFRPPTTWSVSGFTDYDINQLENTNKLPVIWAGGEGNAKFDYFYGECFAETWLRATHNGKPAGAAAVFMPSVSQWNEPAMAAHDEIIDILTESSAENRKYTFGGLSFSGCIHMNDLYEELGCDMTATWNILGDPSLPVRTATPENLVVSHDSSIKEDATSFIVEVFDEANQPVEGALCTLSYNADIIGKNYTDVSGCAVIEITNPLSSGKELDLVVTAHNKIPYSTTIPVVRSDNIKLDGQCFYDDEKTDPVNNLNVTIMNLDTGSRWPATTTDNYYELILDPDTDVSAGDTLRYFATDDGHYINVTDREVTQSDIDSGGITLDLILNEYYTDLIDFPYYPTDTGLGYTTSELSGAACLEMALDYMHWNTSTNDDCPQWTDNNIGDQGVLYEDSRALDPTTADHSYVSARAIQQYLQRHIFRDNYLSYDEYGYNFNIKYTNMPWMNHSQGGDPWTKDTILGLVCIWTDYSTSYAFGNGHDDVALKPGHQPHVPAFVPLEGSYGHWAMIRGIHTLEKPWNFSSPTEAAMDETGGKTGYPIHADNITALGFWVNDPVSTGIGENTYKTYNTFRDTYFKALDQPGDPLHGEFLAVVEPPLDYNEPSPPKITVQSWPEPYTTNPLAPSDLSLCSRIFSCSKIVHAAHQALAKLVTLNEELQEVYRCSYPSVPLYVRNLEEGEDYFMVLFGPQQSSWVPRGSGRSDQTTLVVLVDAETGQLKELSYVETPVHYLPIRLKDACILVGNTLGVDPFSCKASYVCREGSLLSVDVQVITSEGGIYYVDQSGDIHGPVE